MKGKTKNIIVGTGFLAVAAAVTAGISYVITTTLVQEALDRNEPEVMKKAKTRITGTFKETPEYAKALEAAKELEAREHERVEIEGRDGTKLVGHWFNRSSCERIIIAMHGWRSTWSWDFGAVADFLFENNCSVLFAEQRGQGESGGGYMGFGMTERYDCADWAEWANRKSGSSLPIYLIGVSMGATTVLMASGLELPENVHGIIADCGFTSAKAIWKHVCEDNMHISYAVRQKVIDDLCSQKIQYRADEYSTLTALQSNTRPVLFIHGSDDTFVPVTMTYENYKACLAPKELLIVPGAEHGLSYFIEQEKYESTVKEFWRKYDGYKPTVQTKSESDNESDNV